MQLIQPCPIDCEVSLKLTSETALLDLGQHTLRYSIHCWEKNKEGGVQIKKVLREMGGKEKKILNIAKYEV